MKVTIDIPWAQQVGECIEWTGAKNGSGYGYVSLGDQAYGVHRIIMALTVGSAPGGKRRYISEVDHLCRNPLCFNPAHLEIVTRRAHVRRRINTKLDPTKVREIRRLRSELRQTYAHIAKQFGVSSMTVRNVCLKTEHGGWTDVE